MVPCDVELGQGAVQTDIGSLPCVIYPSPLLPLCSCSQRAHWVPVPLQHSCSLVILPQPRYSLGSGSLSHGRGSGANFWLCPDSVVSPLILVSASTSDPTYLSTPTSPLATVLRETRGSQPLLLEVCPSRFHSMPGWRWEKLFRPLIPRGAAGDMGSGNPMRVRSLVRGCHSGGSVFI